MGAALALLTLVGCGGPDDPLPAAPSPAMGAQGECTKMLALQTPDTVMGKKLSVVTDDPNSLVYGPAHDARHRIVVRCGVERPTGLQATSRCDVVNDIGWFSEQLEDSWRFTTIGRSTYVEVQVGADLEPAGNALVDLSEMVSAIPQVKPCQ